MRKLQDLGIKALTRICLFAFTLATLKHSHQWRWSPTAVLLHTHACLVWNALY